MSRIYTVGQLEVYHLGPVASEWGIRLVEEGDLPEDTQAFMRWFVDGRIVAGFRTAKSAREHAEQNHDNLVAMGRELKAIREL